MTKEQTIRELLAIAEELESTNADLERENATLKREVTKLMVSLIKCRKQERERAYCGDLATSQKLGDQQ